MRKLVSSLGLAVCLALLPVKASLAERNLGIEATQSANSQRVSLVIGNGQYKDSPLANPPNDATDVAAALKRQGFAVTLKINASQKEMKAALREFGKKIKTGGTALFYYAGHGVQSSNGRNYLIPVDADIESEAELEDASVDLSLVMSYLGEGRGSANIVILDACRNNPFARSFRSALRGLAQVEAPSGTLIAYATSPGATASDGFGRNGLYTQYLLEALGGDNTEAEVVFKSVRKAVYQATGGKQIPWVSSSLIGDLYFTSSGSKPPVITTRTQPERIDPASFELALWNEIKNRNKPEEYSAYLEQYPNGQFARIARGRIGELSNVTPTIVSDAAKVMIGTWSGEYSYSTGVQANVPFKLTITSINANQFSGLISEPATFGNGTSSLLFAKVAGSIEGGRFQFTKTYDGTGGVSHSVQYQGTLKNEQIAGSWAIGNFTGDFNAIRD